MTSILGGMRGRNWHGPGEAANDSTVPINKVPARSKAYLLRKGDITRNAQSKPEKAEKEGRDTEEANRKLLWTG